MWSKKEKTVNGYDLAITWLSEWRKDKNRRRKCLIVRERETKHISGESFKPCIVGKEGKLLAVDLLTLFFPAAFS